jgi:hypothetical protein
MILDIYPTDHEDWVLLKDDKGFYIRQRDLFFTAFDMYRMMYTDIVIHTDQLVSA